MNDTLITVLVALVLGIVLGLILSFPIMLLWNSFLVPAIPALKEIGWMQAWGILILCQILGKTNIEFKKD